MKNPYVSIGVPVMAAIFVVSVIFISCGSSEIIEIDRDFNMDDFGENSNIGGTDGFINKCFGLGDKKTGGAGVPTDAGNPMCYEWYQTDKPQEEPEPLPPPPPSSSSPGIDPPPGPGPGPSSSSPGSSQDPSSTSVPPGPSSLTCQAVNANAGTNPTAGTPITPPTVRCMPNETPITTGLSWTNAPNWEAPVAGNYSNVTVIVSSGECSGLSASCPGSLTVNAAAVSSSSSRPSSSSVTPSSSSQPSSSSVRSSSSVTPSSSSRPSSSSVRSSSSVTPSSSSRPSSSSVRSSSSVTPSSSSSRPPSSSSAPPSGGCRYEASWCGGVVWDNIKWGVNPTGTGSVGLGDNACVVVTGVNQGAKCKTPCVVTKQENLSWSSEAVYFMYFPTNATDQNTYTAQEVKATIIKPTCP